MTTIEIVSYLTKANLSLPNPFSRIDEYLFVLPKGEPLRFKDSQPKIIFLISLPTQAEVFLTQIKPAPSTSSLSRSHEKSPGQRLSSGDILLIPNGATYQYRSGKPFDIVSVHVINLFFIKQDKALKQPTSLEHFLRKELTELTILKEGLDQEIQSKLFLFREEVSEKKNGFELRVQALALELLILASRKKSQPVRKAVMVQKQKEPHLILALKEIIFKNLDGELTLSDLARSVERSEAYISRIFKKETGQSPFAYIREMRIHLAKSYLQDPSLKLSEIAQKCGFRSLSFFSRTFNQLEGQSPKQYRLTQV